MTRCKKTGLFTRYISDRFSCVHMGFLEKDVLINIIVVDESTRVSLHPIRGVDGSDYINASFIDVSTYYK